MNWGEERSTIIAGLDLGTTKVCAVIAERVAERPLRVIGMGQCPSEGMQRRGNRGCRENHVRHWRGHASS